MTLTVSYFLSKCCSENNVFVISDSNFLMSVFSDLSAAKGWIFEENF